jgi:hypothetical protein
VEEQFGLHLADVNVTPEGSPEAVKLTEVLEPETRVAETVAKALPVWTEPPVLGETERLKSKATTVREKLAVFVNPPPVPVIVTANVPIAAVPLAANVTVEEQFGLQLAGLTETPEGRPVAPKLTETVEGVSEKGRTKVAIVEILAV